MAVRKVRLRRCDKILKAEMHFRRIASFVLGAWLVGSLFALYLSSGTWSATEKILTLPPPEIGKIMTQLSVEQMKGLLGYHSAELVRSCLRDWGLLQLVVGPLMLFLMLRARHVNRLILGVCGAMFIVAIFSSFVLWPEVDYLGRGLQFAPGWSANRARYLALHLTYTILEVLKIPFGVVLAVYLFTYKTHARPAAPVEEEEIGSAADAGNGY